MASVAEIYDWFMTGKKPTQAQFWASWSSFWNKSETIPQSAVSNLTTVLNAKTENDQFNAHKVAADAHQALFEAKVDKEAGKGLSTEDYTPEEKEKLAYLDETKDVDKPVSTAQAAADAAVLASANSHTDSQIANLVNGEVTYDTLKKLADEARAIRAIVGGTTADGDSIINTITELMAVLTTYPEGTDLFTLVQDKVAKADVYNALDCVVSGKVADARQLKVLNDTITALTATVNNKVDKVVGERLISAAEQTQLANLNTNLAAKQDIANQVDVSTSQDAQASWHGKTVFFIANVTITIPGSGLPSGYTFEGVTDPSCSITWAITAPKTWVLGAPAATPEKSIFTLMQLMSNSNKIYLFGL